MRLAKKAAKPKTQPGQGMSGILITDPNFIKNAMIDDTNAKIVAIFSKVSRLTNVVFFLFFSIKIHGRGRVV
jgi:hypothetical protein